MLWLERLWRDIRNAGRSLVKNPGVTAIAVVSMAFGTGANVAVFSAADALILRPLPVERPGELVTVGSQVTRGPATNTVASYPDYIDVRDRAHSFRELVAFTTRNVGFSASPATAPRLRSATLVSENFFRGLGVMPDLGRDFTTDEHRVAGREAVAILSHGLWQREFGADRGVLGQTILIAGIAFTVVGVAPERFTGVDSRLVRESVYVPLAMWPRLAYTLDLDPLARRDYQSLTLKGRLAHGVSLSAARAELALIGSDLERAYPETNQHQQLTAITEFETRFERYPLDSWSLVLLTVLAVAVLTVACANVAALLTSRAPIRAREIAMRLAIGASRARLVRQLVFESLGLALAGGAAGIAVGYAGIAVLRQIEFPTDVIAVPVMQLDVRALAFSLSVAIASALVFGRSALIATQIALSLVLLGLGPAVQTTRVDLAKTVRRCRLAGVTSADLSVAIAIYVFTSLGREFEEGPGFRTTELAKLTIDTSHARYSPAESARFFERALETARQLPGARAAGATSVMPLFGIESTSIVPEGLSLAEGESSLRAFTSTVDEGFFDTMQIPLIGGRTFHSTDTLARPRVAIVNEQMTRHWPGRDVIGQRFRLNDASGPLIEIVGVVSNTKYGYPGEPPQDIVYYPFRQQPRSSMVLLVETAGESASLIAPLREAIRTIDAGVPAYDGQTIEAFYKARATTIGDVLRTLIGAMGLMGITLATVGLYGLVSFSVSRRTRELGIRIAIGASAGQVLRMILRQGMTPAWIGLGAGMVLSVWTMRLLAGAIPYKHPFDPQLYLIVVPLLLATTIVAALVPAKRAAGVDPTVALRCD